VSDTPRPDDTPPGLYDDAGNARFFADPAMDRFVAVVMNMAQELWVQEERLLALEEARGGETVDRDARLKAFIDRMFAPIRGA
jgi:hypothetical protein